MWNKTMVSFLKTLQTTIFNFSWWTFVITLAVLTSSAYCLSILVFTRSFSPGSQEEILLNGYSNATKYYIVEKVEFAANFRWVPEQIQQFSLTEFLYSSFWSVFGLLDPAIWANVLFYRWLARTTGLCVLNSQTIAPDDYPSLPYPETTGFPCGESAYADYTELQEGGYALGCWIIFSIGGAIVFHVLVIAYSYFWWMRAAAKFVPKIARACFYICCWLIPKRKKKAAQVDISLTPETIEQLKGLTGEQLSPESFELLRSWLAAGRQQLPGASVTWMGSSHVAEPSATVTGHSEPIGPADLPPQPKTQQEAIWQEDPVSMLIAENRPKVPELRQQNYVNPLAEAVLEKGEQSFLLVSKLGTTRKNGVRLGNRIVTTAHAPNMHYACTSASSGLLELTGQVVNGVESPWVYYRVRGADGILLDVATKLMTDHFWSKLGVSSSKIARVTKNQPCTVRYRDVNTMSAWRSGGFTADKVNPDLPYVYANYNTGTAGQPDGGGSSGAGVYQSVNGGLRLVGIHAGTNTTSFNYFLDIYAISGVLHEQDAGIPSLRTGRDAINLTFESGRGRSNHMSASEYERMNEYYEGRFDVDHDEYMREEEIDNQLTYSKWANTRFEATETIPKADEAIALLATTVSDFRGGGSSTPENFRTTEPTLQQESSKGSSTPATTNQSSRAVSSSEGKEPSPAKQKKTDTSQPSTSKSSQNSQDTSSPATKDSSKPLKPNSKNSKPAKKPTPPPGFREYLATLSNEAVKEERRLHKERK
jgi:hypothetical protein